MTPGELRQHVETDLSDGALQLLIAAEQEAIDKHAGASASQVDRFSAFGAREIMLTRDASAVDSVRTRYHPDDDQVALSANDYRLEPPRTLVRLSEGDNPETRWVGKLEVTYTPVVNANLRDHVLVQLVKVAIQFQGLTFENVGNASRSFGDHQAMRQKILRQLDGRRAILA